MEPPDAWPPPSPRAAALVRAIVGVLLNDPGGTIGPLQDATLSVSPAALTDDPVLAAEMAASNRANVLHWARCMQADPGARVPVDLSVAVLGIARDTVRRGLDDVIVAAYRAGQNVAWRQCMDVAFQLSSDPEELREALDVTARSIFAFVDDTLAALQTQLRQERSELTRGTHAERFETVTLLLEGAPISAGRASRRLRYDLDRRHTAAILWREETAHDHGDLARAAEALGRAAGPHRPLTVVASASSLWAWFVTGGAGDGPAAAASEIEGIAGVRVAIGPEEAGVDGFRRSHLDALATHRLMARMPPDLRVATYADVQLVALTTADESRAADFVSRTLGDLAHADAELRATVRTYIRENHNASRAAEVLFAHRNTVLNRLARAEKLLPVALATHGLEVGLALEIVHWSGPGARDA